MSRRTRMRRIVLRLLTGVAVALAVVFGLVANHYLKNRPYQWSRTEATLVYKGRAFNGRVFSNGGLYLLELPETDSFHWYIVDPKEGEVYAPNRPFQFLWMCRTVNLGVKLRGKGKAETDAAVEKTRAGYLVRLTRWLPYEKRAPSEEFELLPAPDTSAALAAR